ncbi:MAG: tripeptide aminopeptidase [Thermoleophilaceae bacterium]|jgi:tripeptide aminopeptidase|nr:tripeptide aminopeptidase [Thermoleophilaceae bacterium]
MELVAEFVRLCEIESVSTNERAMADAVSEVLRNGLGLEVSEDSSGSETGSNAGNLLARIPGPDGSRTILLCAHLDTVPLDAPVEVEEVEGVLRNRNEAILGADNKAAVAVILAAARRLLADGRRPPVGIEILFTTCEEHALRGAKEFDLSLLRADYGYVFDHASPIGEVITAAPTYFSIEGRFRGKAVHAGICPEKGHSAIEAAAAAVASMQLGRLDPQTTTNVGRIEGGTASNVVAERCRVQCEARSIDHERAGAVATSIVDAMTEAASDRECDLEIHVEELFRGYKLPRSAPAIEVAVRALEDAGIEPQPIATGGGSDANAFQARGFQCVNLANGTKGAHQPDESVTVDALGTMLDVVLGIVRHSAA